MENENIENKCPNCGSTLKYDVKSKKLKCESCDSYFKIQSLGRGNLDNEELGYDEILKQIRGKNLNVKVVSSLKCSNCGAMLTNDGNMAAIVCPFCGSSHLMEQNIEEEVIPVTGIISFQIDENECNEKFHQWIKGKFFAPSKFKKSKFELDLHPVYLPFLTFDMLCDTTYEAKRGDYEYVTVRRRDAQGNEILVKEKEIRWTHKSGACKTSFDDIIVMGSDSQKNRYYIKQVCKFNFKYMEKYNPKFLVGYVGEKLSIPLEEGLKEAKQHIDIKIKNNIRSDVGGDKVIIEKHNTKYSNITFKQIIAPIYNGIYSYNGEQYHFVINGQTAQFSGDYPKSSLKILLFILGFVAVISLIIILYIKYFYINLY